MKPKKGSSLAALLNVNPQTHIGSIDPCDVNIIQIWYFVNRKKYLHIWTEYFSKAEIKEKGNTIVTFLNLVSIV